MAFPNQSARLLRLQAMLVMVTSIHCLWWQTRSVKATLFVILQGVMVVFIKKNSHLNGRCWVRPVGLSRYDLYFISRPSTCGSEAP